MSYPADAFMLCFQCSTNLPPADAEITALTEILLMTKYTVTIGRNAIAGGFVSRTDLPPIFT